MRKVYTAALPSILSTAAALLAALALAPEAAAQAPPRHDHGFCAIPADPTSFPVTQADGSVLELRRAGGGFVDYLETVDGYTVALDEADGAYEYLLPAGPSGELFLSGVAAHAPAARTARERTLLAQLTPHARFEGVALAERLAATSHALVHDHAGGKSAARGLIERSFPSTGIRRALLLLIDYPDLRFRHTVAEVERLANEEGYDRNGQTGSFRDYYLDASYGTLEVNTDVAGWYTASRNRAYYGYADGNGYPKSAEVIREAVDAAEDAGVDFSRYDNDGDGDVDVVMVIHAGLGAEQSDDDDDIWSHRWSLRATQQAVTYDGVRVNDYIVQPERQYNRIAHIGVLVHEFGHALGLPDLYDTDYSSAGIGRWGAMSGGSWNNSGRTPARMSAWCSEMMGWTTPEVLDVAAGGTLADVPATALSARAYRLNTGVEHEYFLIEVRDAVKWDAHLPGHGVLVWHVDMLAGNNRDEARRLVDLEQADGRGDLYGSGGSDAGDAFPGSAAVTEIACGTFPNLDTYAGDAVGRRLSEVTFAGGRGGLRYGTCANDCALGTARAGEQVVDCGTQTFTQAIAVTHALTSGNLTATVTVADGRAYTAAATVDPAGEQTVSVAGIPAASGALRMSVAADDVADCRRTVGGLTYAPAACVPLSDDVCDARDITAAIDGAAVLGNNTAYTAQPGEPQPTGGDCREMGVWCDGDGVDNSAWFTFLAPSSGSVSLAFSEGPDLQAALWEAVDCEAVLSAAARWLVTANDDGDRAYRPAFEGLDGLVPGKRYYLQVDGYGGEAGDFAFALSSERAARYAGTADGDCGPGAALASGGRGEWLHLRDGGGAVVASVNDRGATLGNVSAGYGLSAGAARTDADGDYLLDRDYGLSVDTDGAATLRLYLTDAEWAALRDRGGLSDLGALTLKRYPGADCGAHAGPAAVFSPTYAKAAFDGDRHLVQFEIPGGGAFTLGAAGTLLPVELSAFSAAAEAEVNRIAWTTTSEVDVAGFAVERSPDGRTGWTAVAEASPTGGPSRAADYVAYDRSPLPEAYYRLRSTDLDGSEELSEVAVVTRAAGASVALGLRPNPITAGAGVRVVGVTVGETVAVYDAAGRQVLSVSADAAAVDLPTADLPAGVYAVRVRGVAGTQAVRLVVR